ncbi:hypothetical protein GCM10023083_02110 [Streptomyces phyllanthi]
MPAPATAPHDGGALLPDDSGDRKSGHATASVSCQYLGCRPLPPADMAGIVRVRAAHGCTERDGERVKCEPERACFPARPGDPTPLPLVDVAFGFCWRQLPTQLPHQRACFATLTNKAAAAHRRRRSPCANTPRMVVPDRFSVPEPRPPPAFGR